jgi:hypothetical protein
LPALEEKWPLASDENFHASQHPFLPRLPAIKFALTSDSCKTLSCRENARGHQLSYPLFNDCKTSYVAQCFELLAKFQTGQLLNLKFPNFHERPLENVDPELPPNPERIETDVTIRKAFFGLQGSHVISKRILCNFVSLLFERCHYLFQMQEYTSNIEPVRQYLYSDVPTAFLPHSWVYSDQDLISLAQPAAVLVPVVAPGSAPAAAQLAAGFQPQKEVSMLPVGAYIPNFYAKLLHCCVDEAAFLAGAHLPPDEPQVWVLRPCNYSELRLLVSLPPTMSATSNFTSVLAKFKLEDFVGVEKRILIKIPSTAGKVEQSLQQEIAPFFNLRDSVRFKKVIEQSEYVLTTEFLLKLFLLQGRRSCRSSLVFSGVCLF